MPARPATLMNNLSTASDMAEKAADKGWEQAGPFGAGVVFGMIVTLAANFLISRERVIKYRIDQEREKELFKQLEIKESRIGRMHDQVEDLQSKLARATNPRGGKR